MSNQGVIEDAELPLEVENPDAPDPEAERLAAIETEARRQGWRPREEYRGVPGGWRTAEEFMKRGQDILPIVRKDLERERERSSKMEQEIVSLRQSQDEQKLVMQDLLAMARNANEAGYRRALDALKVEKRNAAAQGDIAKVVALDEQISEVEEERATATKPLPNSSPTTVKASDSPQPQPKVPVVDPIVARFVDDNPWFKTDQVLNRAMEAEHLDLLQNAPGLSLEENLERAKEAVMARYPQKFGITPRKELEPDGGNPPASRRTNVSSPTPAANSRRTAPTGIASIEDPQERAVAQQAYARAKRQMPEITEAEWFALYDNPKADVMDMLATKKKGGK